MKDGHPTPRKKINCYEIDQAMEKYYESCSWLKEWKMLKKIRSRKIGRRLLINLDT